MSTAKKAEDNQVEEQNVAPEVANTNTESIEPPKAANTNVEPADTTKKLADSVSSQVAEHVELPTRPISKAPKMATMERQIQLGRDHKISLKLAEDMRLEVGMLAKKVLSGEVTGLGVPSLEDIEASKELTRSFKVSIANLIIATLGKSKEHKALRRALKKADSASAILMAVESYAGSDQAEIDNLFVEGLLAMYGLINPDNISKILAEAKIKIDDTEVSINDELISLLGKPANENAASGSVLRNIMYRESLLAAGDANKAKKIAENFAKCRTSRPIDAKSEDPVYKETVQEIARFRDAITEAKKSLTDASIVKEANEPELARNTAKLDEVNAKLSAKNTQVDTTTRQVRSIKSDIDNLRTKGSALTADEMARLNAMTKQFEADSQLLAQLEKEKNELEKSQAELQKAIEIASGGSGEQRVALLKAKSAFVETITTFTAHIDRRLAQMAKSKKVVDLAPYQKLKALKDAVQSMTETKIDQQASYLEASLGGIANILNIAEELSGFTMAIAERKNYSEEELAMAYLKNKYVDLGYSDQQAEMAAIIEYTRCEREAKLAQFQVKANEAKAQRMDGIFKRAWNEKIKGSIEYMPADRAMKVCARNPRAEVEQEEHTALEGLVGLSNFTDVRNYLMQGKISRNALTTFMYELMSLVGGRKVDDGTIVTLKTANDVGKVESMVLNINKFLAEDSALEIIKRSEDAGSLPENGAISRAELVAKTLKGYNDEISNTEILLATRAFTSDSSILTKAKIKQGVKDILAQVDESGMSKAEFMAELQRHGLSGLENGFAVNRLRMNQIGRVLKKGGTATWNGTKWVGNKTKDLAYSAYENKGKAARAVGRAMLWPIKAPFRLAGWMGSKVINAGKSALNFTQRSIIKASMVPLSLATAAFGTVTAPLTVGIKAAKIVKENGEAVRDEELAKLKNAITYRPANNNSEVDSDTQQQAA